MCHSVTVSLCALFSPFQHSIHFSNATKQAGTSMFPAHLIFVSKMFLTPMSIKNLPIPTPTQINALNIATAAIIIRQIGKKFRVIKPGIFKICHGSNSQQLHILVATKFVNNRTA